jgi:hypothetical protein
MYIKDEDDVNTIIAEHRAYKAWEREQKNKILDMTNSQRKQQLWSQLFTPTRMTDDYLAGNLF